MEVLTTKEMKELDRYTCKKKGISSLELMEIAGEKIYKCILKEKEIDPVTDKIVIISGTGNNGGDSLVVATHFLEENYKNLEIILVGNLDHLTEETKINLKKLKERNARIYYFKNYDFYKDYEKLIKKANIIIEGIFGIGLNRDVEGIYYQAIDGINRSEAYTISIDIPSGIRGDNGLIAGIAVKADLSIIIHTYKVGNLLNDAKDSHGKCKIVDIGILEDVFIPKQFLLQEKDIKNLLKKRRHNTHKYDYGSVLTIGGSIGMMGAPFMSAYAALRSGSGLSSIAVYEKYLDLIYPIYPEIMIRPYRKKEEFLEILQKKEAIAFGPGLGRKSDFPFYILEHLLKVDLPIVIDADGLYYFKELLNKVKKENKIVITPHYGEMAMLLDTTSENIKRDPVSAAKEFSEKYSIIVLLKGTTTLIAQQDKIYFHSLGNPGMATAGSGDVLTGIVLSLLGQRLKPIDACKVGVSIHSLAGNLAAKEMGQYSMIATDIIKYIPKTLKELVK